MINSETVFFKRKIEHQLLFRLAFAAFFLAIVVVILGAFTRLVDAGLGCPDWPGCYGHLLWPDEAHEIALAELKFPGAPVETDKTWPEMVHRYFAGMLGLLILAIVVFSVRRSTQVNVFHPVPLRLSLLLLALVVLQAAFGMWTVTLKLWPQVVTAHLLGGFTTLSLIWLLVQRLSCEPWKIDTDKWLKLQKIKPLMFFSLAMVVLQITLGGWVSSNYAALACPDLPQCLGQWLPSADFRQGFNIFQKIGPNYLGGQLDNFARTAIHLSHRLGAVIVLIALITFGFKLWRLHLPFVRVWVLILWGVLFLQILLGICNILFALPLAIAVAHNAVGAVLLLVLISIIYRVHSAITTDK